MMAEGQMSIASRDPDCTVLLEVDNLNTAIKKSLKSSSRVKFTCFNVSNRYIIIGANSGGIYVYSRSSLKFLHLAPNHEGPITKLSISPDETKIGYSTRKGLIVILEFHNNDDNCRCKKRFVSHEHRGWDVTCMTWSCDGNKMFIGDDAGKVSLCEMIVSKAKKLFDATAMVVKADHAIVQLDFYAGFLLISTMYKSFLCDTIRETFATIGSKPREGEYGACFYPESKTEFLVYCARPGTRLWEVDMKGVVINTHQLKKVLSIPPLKIISYRDEVWSPSSESGIHQSVAFKKLHYMNSHSKYIVASNDDSIYVFDAKKAIVIFWSAATKGASDLKVVNNHIYTFYEDGSLRKMSVMPLEKVFGVLHTRRLNMLLTSLLSPFEADIINMLTRSKSKKVFKIFNSILTNSSEQSELKEAILRLFVQIGMDDVSLESWVSEDGADRYSCSPTLSELSFREGNRIVVVNQPSSFSDLDSEFDFDINDTILKKWNSLPVFDDPSGPNKNPYKDTSAISVNNLEQSLSAPEDFYSRCEADKSESLPNFKDNPESCSSFLDVSLEDQTELHSRDITGDEFVIPIQEYIKPNQFVPLYGGFPRGVANASYSDILENIEFDKIKDRLSNTISTGKRALLFNIKEIEGKIMSKPNLLEVFDVRPEKMDLSADALNSLDHEASIDDDLVWNEETKEPKTRKEASSIECDELLIASEHALKNFESPIILYDISHTKEILSAWVEVLHHHQLLLLKAIVKNGCHTTTSTGIHDRNGNTVANPPESPVNDILNANLENVHIVEDTTFVSDLFNLPRENHENIAKLVNFCIQSSLFGDLAVFQSYLASRDASRQCGQCHDCRLSSFATLYFHFIDVDELHAMTLRSSSLSVCGMGLFRTWCTIMSCVSSVQDEAQFVIETPKLSAYLETLFGSFSVDSSKMFSCLYKLMDNAPECVIEWCARKRDHINPVDVLYLSMNSDCHPKWFMSYMSSILEQSLVSKKKIFESWLVRFTWVREILKENTNHTLRCECGYPSPSSHLFSWPYDNIISYALDSTDEGEYVQILIDLCFKNCYWLGYLQMLMKTANRNEMLKIIIALSDLYVLKINSHYPKTNEEWKLILQLIMKQSGHSKPFTCINCEAEIEAPPSTKCLTLQAVVKEMFQVMQPKKLISMLTPLNIPKNKLSSSIYQASIVLTALNKQQNVISDQILKQYDTQLWSKRSRNIPQEIMQVFRYEISTRQDQSQKDKIPDLQFEDLKSSTRASTLSQPDRHWGLTSNLSNRCLYCNIVLSDHIISNENGITIFACGHSYHTGCASYKYCLQCASKQ